MASHLNRRWFAVASAPGTGDIAVGSAQAGYAGLGAANDGQVYDGVTFLDGSAWEVRNGCTYTHGTTTLSRGTLEDSSTGSALSLSASATVMLSVSAAAVRRYESAALAHAAGPNAATAMAVGTLYVVDGSALTATRTYTLPASAQVGDRVGVMMSAGSSSYEVILTAASGDTLNGVAGGTEWSRVFQAGEVVVMRCVAADAAWVVEQEGRIPQLGEMSLTADCDGEAANTTTLPTSASTPGTWTVNTQRGIGATASTGRFTVRRAGSYLLTAGGRAKDSPGATSIYTVQIMRDGSVIRGGAATIASGNVSGSVTATLDSCAAGAYYQMAYSTGSGGLGCRGSQGLTYLTVTECLP